MKKHFILFGIITFFLSGCMSSQKQIDVPAAVQVKFKSLYPESKKVKWEMEDGRYEAGFDVNKVETAVQFSPDGNLFLTETEIHVSELPSAITDYVNQNMPGKKISEASKMVTAEGIVSFEAKVDKTDYLFDSEGKFTGKESEEEGEEEEDEDD